jgi:hypothetical protein
MMTLFTKGTVNFIHEFTDSSRERFHEEYQGWLVSVIQYSFSEIDDSHMVLFENFLRLFHILYTQAYEQTF